MPKRKTFYAFTEIDENNQNEIVVAKTGKWRHPYYGDFNITKATLNEFVKNFKDKVRGVDIGVDKEHQSYNGYVGWYKELKVVGTKLIGVIDWTAEGAQLIKDKVFRYFSPEIAFEYEDMETHKIYSNVLIGGGITNRPYFKGLKPLLAHEDKSNANDANSGDKFILFLNENAMNDYAKKYAELKAKGKITEAEFNELKGLYAKMSEDDQGAEETKPDDLKENVETPADGGDNGDAGKGDAGDGANDGGNNDAGNADAGKGDGDADVQANEKVAKVIADNLALTEKVAKMEADARSTKLSEKVNTLVCSESNDKGAFLPKAKDSLQKFFESLNDKQVAAFQELMPMLAKTGMFNEAGDAGDNTPGGGAAPAKTLNHELTEEAKKLVAEGKFKDADNPFEAALFSLKDKYQSAGV